MASIFDRFKSLDPAVQAALIQLGGGAIAGVGDQIAAGQARSDDRNALRAQMIDRALADQMGEDFSRAQAGLAATQMDPYTQNRALFRARAMGQLFGGARNAGFEFDPSTGMGKFTGGISIPEGGLDVTSLSPEALAEGAGNFYRNVAQVQPRVAAPNLGRMGLGEAGESMMGDIEGARVGALNDLEAARKRRMDLINQSLQEKKKGGGFWGKLGKIAGLASFAIPIVGPAVGMGAMATTAAATGLGALSGATRGGVSGAVTGAMSGYGGAKKPIFKLPAKRRPPTSIPGLD